MSKENALVIFAGMGDDGLHGIRFALFLTKILHQDAPKMYCVPFGWKTHITAEQFDQRYQELKLNELKKIQDQHQHVALMGVSAGAAPALMYALEHPELITSVVSFCGCIQYDKEYLDATLHEAYKHSVKKLQNTFKSMPKATDGLAKKTMIVTAKKDAIIPLKLQYLPGAAQNVEVSYSSHMLATTVGLIQELTKGKKSEIFRWLTQST